MIAQLRRELPAAVLGLALLAGAGCAGAACRPGPASTPGLGRWSALSTAGAPPPALEQVGVWTGSELFVFGGAGPCTVEGVCGGAGRYDPARDAWAAVSPEGAPSARAQHAMVWTGATVLVWGGRGCGGGASPCGDGAAYDPGADRWSPLASAGAPAARGLHAAVWTGSRLIVFGGQVGVGGAILGDGAAYDPAADAWTRLASVGAPSPRRRHVAVWTGEELLVWGGDGGGATSAPLGDGARYDPAADRWAPISSVGAPHPRWSAAAVWTGSEMVVWGGLGCSANPGADLCDSGGAYDPVADRWRPLAAIGSPTARSGHGAVWTGERVIVWGGGGGGCAEGGGGVCSDGALYDPTADRWLALARPGSAAARGGHLAVWTGAAMIVWGGSGPQESVRADGLRLVP